MDNTTNNSPSKGIKEYKCNDLIVLWEPGACSHSGKCLHGEPEVFDFDRRPWIKLDQASPEDIIKTIDKCPSGALKYRLPEGSRVNPEMAKGKGWVDYQDTAAAEVTIRMVNRGPLMVKGPVRILDASGSELKKTSQVALCACGRSANLPYCDGSHLKNQP